MISVGLRIIPLMSPPHSPTPVILAVERETPGLLRNYLTYNTAPSDQPRNLFILLIVYPVCTRDSHLIIYIFMIVRIIDLLKKAAP
jgi:hypothetical protein